MASNIRTGFNIEQNLSLILHFPQIFVNANGDEYRGFIINDNKSYEINLKLLKDDNKYHLKMTDMLKPFEKEIENILRPPADALCILEKIQDLVTLYKPNTLINTTNTDKAILKEYMELCEFHINIHKPKLSADLKEVYISMLDEEKRVHEMLIHTSHVKGEPLFKVVQCNVPEFSGSASFPADNSLISIYESLVAKVDDLKMQQYLQLLDVIDQNCWVLEPENACRKDTYRRIALESNLSLIITFMSLDIRQVPNIKFFGPSKLTRIYEDRVFKNYSDWDSSNDTMQELLKLLEIPCFPQKMEQDHEEELLVNSGECCICYSLRLDNKLPEIVCANSCCNQFFHKECLFECLVALKPITDDNEITGKCPNCDKCIHCPLLHKY